ncbi:MAG: ribosome maturation factor RimP [Streptococcaceae bacterium]|nr:ribosome maturation factor RimP [Streptococcaceae bacterium]
MSELTEIVEDFISPHVPEPFYIYAVEWEKMGNEDVLRVLVDKPGGIELDETSDLSEIISPLLDKIKPDPFPKAGYMLEVASPGAERPLTKTEQFDEALASGEDVFISCYQKVEGQKEFVGKLSNLTENELTLVITDKNKHKEISIARSNIAKAQTILLL